MKNLVVLAALVVGLASCSKDEIPETPVQDCGCKNITEVKPVASKVDANGIITAYNVTYTYKDCEAIKSFTHMNTPTYPVLMVGDCFVMPK